MWRLRSVACTLAALALSSGAGVASAQDGLYQISEFDADESGSLEPKEFTKFLQTTPAKGQSKDQVRGMFKRIDSNNDNGVDQAEFDAFLDQMASDPPPPPPPKSSKKKSSKKDKADPKLQAKQLRSLQDFYKKHVPDKDPDDVADLVMKAKRRSGETWYAEMCAKLEDKYGENPSVFLESAGESSSGSEESTGGSESGSGTDTASESASPAQALRTKAAKNRKVRREILTVFYGKHAPEKTAEDIDKIITKREGKAKGSGAGWFFEMCDKLTEKYGEDVFELAAAQAEEPASSSSDEEYDAPKDSEGEDAGSGGEAQVEEEVAAEPTPPPPPPELSAKEKLLARLAEAAQGIDDLELLEETVAAAEKAAAEAAEVLAQESEAKAEEERLKAEEEAKVKAERKAAARARAEKAKAEAAERRAKEEAAEEAALELETFDAIDMDDESSMVLVDAEVIDWLDEQRLADYTPQIVSYGGKLAELMRRIKSDDIAGFGMTMAESARLKKGLKKLRKDARADAEAKAEKEAKKAEASASEEEEGGGDAEEAGPSEEPAGEGADEAE